MTASTATRTSRAATVDGFETGVKKIALDADLTRESSRENIQWADCPPTVGEEALKCLWGTRQNRHLDKGRHKPGD
jgi:hypothetical protein